MSLKAQNHIPEAGDTIMFYPLGRKALSQEKGFDCFYDADKVCNTKLSFFHGKSENEVYGAKKNKFKFKPKYRFNSELLIGAVPCFAVFFFGTSRTR